MDVRRDRLDAGVIADFGQHALQIDADRARDRRVLDDDRHLLPGRAGFLDQVLGLFDVRRRPFGAGVLRVGTIGLIAREARRQNLTGRSGENRPAEQVDDRRAVDGEIDRLARLDVVERRDVGVHRRIPHRGQRIDVDLFLILRAQFREPIGRRLVEHPVRLAVLHGGHLGLVGQAEVIDDLVRVAVRLRILTPHLEIRIPDKLQTRVRIVACNHVRAGARNRRGAGILRRRVGRQNHRMRHRELIQNLRILLR